MPDHEVHEIQLNGKQLVFMFMAATVVSVVIFLCGVMVGRGVRQPVADTLAVSTGSSIDPTTPPDASSGKPAPAAEPAPEKESLSYAERLEPPAPLSEPLRLTETKPAVAPAANDKSVIEKAEAEKPAPRPSAAPQPKEQATRNLQSTPAAKPDAVVASAERLGKGVVFQVQAFPTIEAAEALAARLKSKGYPAFVVTNPENVTRGRYRVRVGKYTNKRDADAVFLRLKQEEHFDPWRIP